MSRARNGHRYRHLDTAILRATTADGHHAPPDWPDMGDPAQAPAWSAWLAETWSDERLAAAVEVASPVLATRIKSVLADGRAQPARVRKMVFSLARYSARWRGRATPFGLFAGVAPLRFGDRADVRWDDRHRVVRRADTRWLAAAVARLESDGRIRESLTVVTNDLVERLGDRLVVGAGSGTRYDTAAMSVRRTCAVERMVELAAEPIAVKDLVAAAAAEFPGAGVDVVASAVGELMHCGVLITNLTPPSSGGEDIDHVVDRLREVGALGGPEVSPVVDSITDLRRCRRNPVTAALGTPVAEPLPEHRLAVTTVLGCAVDLPHAVGEVAAAAVDALGRLSPARGEHPAWRTYRRTFLARYGHGAVVPLLDLVDPVVGLGYPWSAESSGSLASRPMTSRDERLLELAQQAALDRVDEVVLDDGLIDALTDETTPPDRPPPHAPHLDAIVDVRASTTTELDSGAFTVAINGIGRTAIATAGRFLASLDDADRQRIVARYRDLPVSIQGAVAAQLSYRATRTAARNVTSVPTVLGHLLHVGEHPGTCTAAIRVTELAVTADLRAMYLLSMTTGEVIEPTAVNAVARHAMPDLVRLLVELPRATCVAVVPFSWGAAACLPFRPRVRHGRAVLGAAAWKVGPALLPAPSASQRVWADGLLALRERRGVPSAVHVGEGDRRLRLELDEPRDVALLRAHLDRVAAAVELTEAPSPADHGWIDGRAHEIVVSIASTAEPTAVPDVLEPGRPRAVVGRDHGILPGAGVLSARLDCHPDAVEPIIVRHLPDLLGRWDTPPRWWFVRLTNPAPHLRVRLHVERYGPAAERIGDWAAALRRAGLCGDLTLDTYRPEVGRYGGSRAAMDAAELVFAADSAAARAQLAVLRRTPAVNPIALTAASMVDLASAAHDGRAAGAAWLVRRADLVAKSRNVDRAVLRQALALTTASMHAHPLLDEPDLVAAWANRDRATRAYMRVLRQGGGAVAETILVSLLHMHHVRALGPDAAGEASCHRLARAAALSITTRESTAEVPA